MNQNIDVFIQKNIFLINNKKYLYDSNKIHIFSKKITNNLIKCYKKRAIKKIYSFNCSFLFIFYCLEILKRYDISFL